MTTCNHPNQMTWLYALGRKTITCCPDCLAALQALGMTFRERRETNLTPIREQRRPAWLDRLTARDETGRIA